MVLVLTLAAVVIVVAFYLRSRFDHAGQLIERIPGQKSWPIIGNTISYMFCNPEQLFMCPRMAFVNYGYIHKLVGFRFRAVGIYNPDDVEVLLSTTKFNNKQNPYTFLKPWLSEGLLTSNGKKWQKRRKLLTPAFHFNILKKYMRIFNDHSERLLSKIREAENEQIDIMTLVSEATLNVMCETSMGTSMNEDKGNRVSDYLKGLHTFGASIAHRVTNVWLHKDFIFNIVNTSLEQKKAVKDLHAFTTKIINDRKMILRDQKVVGFANNNEDCVQDDRPAMLDLLIQNEKEGKINDEGIREEVDTFLFEGHDTTAVALGFMIMRIANEPKCQRLLFEEMVNIFGESQREATAEDLNNMKYLDCCIKESMRLYPSVPFIARYTTEDVTLSGYVVPSGTECHIHIFDIHRLENFYPEPEKFLPERFQLHNTIKRHPYSYIPFSAGPRNCIGQKFAMMEMKIIMSGLLRRFRLEPVTTPEDLIFKADIVLRTSNPLYVRFYPK